MESSVLQPKAETMCSCLNKSTVQKGTDRVMTGDGFMSEPFIHRLFPL